MAVDSKIQTSIPLAPLTTFKIGGPAKFFVEAESAEELVEAINWAKEKGEKYYVLGGGSNLLISDKGFNGLVIKNSCKEISLDNEKIIAESGAPLAQLVQFAAANGLIGLEWAAGIPGTVGGAIRGNAGAYGASISLSLESVKVYSPAENKIEVYDNQQCKFVYRHSIFKESELIILSCALRLRPGEEQLIKKTMAQYLTERQSQPKQASAGCIFKNILTSDLESEKGRELLARAKEEGVVKGDKISTGWLIAVLGMKGKVIGGAKISLEHANFIVNTGKATAEDVITLISLIKQKVRVEAGVQLQNEIQFLDF